MVCKNFANAFVDCITVRNGPKIIEGGRIGYLGNKCDRRGIQSFKKSARVEEVLDT